MAIRIEIIKLSENDGRVTATAAFYFPVALAQQSPLAADPSRVPAGTKLSAGEIADLKDGKLIEEVRAVDITGMLTAEHRAALTAIWSERRPIALAAYAARNRLIGDTWTDAPGWVNG